MIKGCLIGQDVRFSYSKKIHEALGTIYDLISLNINEVKNFLDHNDYDFINVTTPYKEEILKYLDILSPEVKEIGACNLIKKVNNQYVGYNTDYSGFLKSLEFHHIDYHDKNVLILGTGGACKAVSYALKDFAKRIDVVSRTKDGFISYNEVNKQINQFDLIINATPYGMIPKMELVPIISLADFKGEIVDIIYNPRRTTLFLEAEKYHIKAVNGIAMLVFQALYAYQNFENISAKALIDLLNKERNIVIIGMPYAGKSYLGSLINEIMPERDLYDIDSIIEERYGEIGEIFNKYGEDKFRDYEEEIIKEVSVLSNAIIIPGGGFFKRANNVTLLKQNGMLYFLNKNLDEIIENYKLDKDNLRPLIKDIKDLEKIYQERYDIYNMIKDDVVKGDFDDYYSF